jgi:hypothetical protein
VAQTVAQKIKVFCGFADHFRRCAPNRGAPWRKPWRRTVAQPWRKKVADFCRFSRFQDKLRHGCAKVRDQQWRKIIWAFLPTRGNNSESETTQKVTAMINNFALDDHLSGY